MILMATTSSTLTCRLTRDLVGTSVHLRKVPLSQHLSKIEDIVLDFLVAGLGACLPSFSSPLEHIF